MAGGPALRFGDPRVQALASALANQLFAVAAITNKSLRALMTGLLGTSYSMNQASYDLTRLRLNGLITRVPDHHRYTLTTDGQQFAIFYTKVHDRVLRPLLAAATQPNAPPNPTRHPNYAPRYAPSTRQSTSASPTRGCPNQPNPTNHARSDGPRNS